VLMLYVWVALTAALLLLRVRPRELSAGQASATDEITVAVVVGGALMLTIPAAYVAASNLGIVPLTGQNMPFLGLNAWSDAAFVSAMVTAMIAMLATGSATRSAGGRSDDDELTTRVAA
jgi:cell division protein FtsW (lipid II flippase)